MRWATFYLIIILSISSCGIYPANYTQINVLAGQLKTAEYEDKDTYYTFAIDSGKFKGYLFQVTLVDGGKTAFYADFVHPSLTERCLPAKRNKWWVRENKNNNSGSVTMEGAVKLSCGNEYYKVTFNYSGNITRKIPNQTH